MEVVLRQIKSGEPGTFLLDSLVKKGGTGDDFISTSSSSTNLLCNFKQVPELTVPVPLVYILNTHML